MKQNICVDVGNSCVKIGIFNLDKLEFSFQFDVSNKTSDEFYYVILNIIKSNQIEIVENNLIYSSVVPSLNLSLRSALERVFKPMNILSLQDKIKTGLALKVDNPNEVGTDLIASMVGAKKKYGAPTIVVDTGTATKVLLLDKDNFFSGAAFMPGLVLSSLSLADKAEQLPKVALDIPKRVASRNTIDCMNSGLIFGHADAIKGLIERFEEEIGYKCHRVITGGVASILKDVMRTDIVYDPFLVLEGLNEILNKNL